MVYCTSPVHGWRTAEGAMRIISAGTKQMIRLAHQPEPSPPLSKEASRRLQWFTWHQRHGHNVSKTCRHFAISRQTFYTWQQRFNPRRLSSLEHRSSRPKRRRQRTWTIEQVQAVKQLREQHPRWGKDKLARLLPKEMRLSVSMVGRIINYLKRCGDLVEPARRPISVRKRRLKRPYAIRKPKDYQIQAPGDLVQMDTVDVRPVPGVVLKHFTAHDVVSKYNVLELKGRATARTASQALEAVLERMPFRVKACQIDGGSEFMADFELACQAKGIALFVLPPRSPKLNGGVERANRTHTEEFYECSSADPTVAALGAELGQWEVVYNTVRPHQALGYLTPEQFVDRWNQQPMQQQQEVACG